MLMERWVALNIVAEGCAGLTGVREWLMKSVDRKWEPKPMQLFLENGSEPPGEAGRGQKNVAIRGRSG